MHEVIGGILGAIAIVNLILLINMGKKWIPNWYPLVGLPFCAAHLILFCNKTRSIPFFKINVDNVYCT